MTLTEFLEARIAEDEATVEGMDVRSARVAAECDAKRAILNIDWGALCDVPACSGGYEARDGVLLPLAYIYAGHPDYLPEWRP